MEHEPESERANRPLAFFGIGLLCGLLFNVFGFATLCLLSYNSKTARRRRRYLCAGISAGVLLQVALLSALVFAIPYIAVKNTLEKRRPLKSDNAYRDVYDRHKHSVHRLRDSVSGLCHHFPLEMNNKELIL